MSAQDIAEKHRPVIYLHPQEKYYPYSIERWFENTVSMTINGNTSRATRVGLDAKTMAEYRENVPVTYRIQNYDSGEVKSITYFIFFAYNGSKRILGSAPTGAHTADIEEFYVELTKEGDVAFYGMSTHGDLNVYNVKPGYESRISNHPKYPDDNPVDASRDLEFEDGLPVIYSSVNAHALYGSPGSFMRFGGVGNDITGKGLPIRPVLKNIESLPEIWSYEGYIGEDSVGGLKARFYGSAPKLYSKAVKHKMRIPEWATWFAYLGFAFIPLILGIALRRKTLWIPIVVSITFFLFQFYFIKILLFLIGDHVGIKTDVDSWDKWVFPFRLF